MRRLFTHWVRPRNSPPPSPHLGSYTRALLVSHRRNFFVTPCRADLLQSPQGISLWPSSSHLYKLQSRPPFLPAPPHCNGYSVYIFLFWELRGLSPNFHINVSVSDLYIPRIGPHISSSRKGRPFLGIYNLLTDTWMWKLGLRPRYSFPGNILFPIFVILSLQCTWPS
jgi:hypothetical protein